MDATSSLEREGRNSFDFCVHTTTQSKRAHEYEVVFPSSKSKTTLYDENFEMRRGVAELLLCARGAAFSGTTTRTSSSLSASTSSLVCCAMRNSGFVGVSSQKGRGITMSSTTTTTTTTNSSVDARWKPHQPVQSKRPAYAPSDTPHTKKWLDSDASKAPIDWISEVQPIGVNGSKVNCHSPGACKERFGEGAALGAPATFYTLADTSVENPAKCKYCGLRFYSLEGSH